MEFIVPMFGHKQSAGLSLIEVIVVIAIVAILTTLSFVGVQSIRESARSVACRSRLVSIGLATAQYESSQSRLPGFHWIFELMPYLELGGIAKEISSKKSIDQISGLLCPSDVTNRKTENSYSSYLGNAGTWVTADGYDGVLGVDIPPTSTQAYIKLNEITDGLSNTSFAAEALTGSTATNSSTRLRTLWATPGQQYRIDELEEFLAVCTSIDQDPIASGWRGNDELKGAFYENGALSAGLVSILYNHAATPQNPSCSNRGNILTGISTSTSHHPQVVNVVFCDGHVSATNREIDILVWRSFGSRQE